jgi:hypothetical protein
MKGALPLSRLKVKDKITQNKIQSTHPIDGEYLDIDNIIDYRQRNKKREFLVKWKDLPDSENSWVEEQNFSDPVIIKNYFSKKRKSTQKVKLNIANIQINYSQTKIQYLNNLTQINHNKITLQILIIIIFNILTFANATIISDNFNFCQSRSNMPTLDIENLCKVQTIKQEQLIPPSNSTRLIILSKLHNIVNGIGYECSKTITTRTLKQNIFGFKSLIKQTTNVISLTQEDCQYMKLTRKCENKPMICEGLICHLIIISEQDFIYMPLQLMQKITVAN